MQHRRAGLALLVLLPLLLGSGLVTAPGTGGGGAGTGDITDVFSCPSGDCNLVHVQDGEILDTSGTGVIDATTAKALFANPADCGANAYATTIAANGDLTCASVTFAQLTGTVTDCAAGQFVKGIDAGTVLDCATPATSGAPLTATYITQVPDITLLNEQAMSALGTGLTINTTATGVQSIYTGSSCTNQFPRSINASGALTCGSVTATDVDATIPTLAFKTVNTTSGTAPVADSATDTLTLTAGTNVTITGNAATDTITIDAAGGGGGAPTTSTYITQTPDAGLSAEQAMSTLGTGLVLNTTTTGVQSIYAGNTCTNQFPRSDNASGAWTCASVGTADITNGTIDGSDLNTTVAGAGLSGGGGSALATASNEQNFLLSGALTCGAATNGKMQVHSTTPLQYCDNNAVAPILQYAAYANNIGVANLATSLAADPTDCSANQFANAIAASGNLTCAQPAFTDITGTVGDTQIAAGAVDGGVGGEIQDGTIDANDLNASVAGAGLSGGAGTALATASDEQFFIKTGALTCGAGTAGKALVHTTPLQYCDNSGVPILRYAAYGNTAGVATLATNLEVNPADCSANQFANAIAGNGDLTCAQVNFTQLTGTATDAQLANNYSGVGACAASKWVSTLNDNAAGTCTQPAFTDISGTLAHSSLSGLTTGDDHTQYLLLAGRSGGQTANGGTASGDDLTLSSTANATKGSIFFGSEWEWTEDSPDAVDSASTNAGAWTPTVSITGTSGGTSNTRGLYLNPTVNYNDAAGVVINNYKAVEGAGTFTVSGAATQASSWTLFDGTATLDASVATKVPPTPTVFRSGVTMKYSATSGTGNMTGNQNVFYDQTLYRNVDAGGTFTVANPSSFASSMQFTETAGALNITTARGFLFLDPTISGTPQITTLVGVDVSRPTKALTVDGNIGIRNAGSTVLTPCTLTVTAGLTISPTCSAIEMTSAGAVTCNTTTCIAAGANGQMLTLFNFGANTITIDGNGGNTRLNAAADYLMGQWDTLTVMYSTSFVAWIEISRSNN